MLRRHLFSHGFTPPLIALIAALLLDNVLQIRVNAKEGKCRQQNILKKGFTLKVKDEKARRLLTNARTLKECIALSCKFGGADYAVYENGRCHALTCKKNACKITKDVKSTQKIASLSRRGKLKVNKRKKQHSKRKAKETYHNAIPTEATRKHNDAPTIASNWTLAFSTVVVPTNKSNPQLTRDYEPRVGISRMSSPKKKPHKVQHTEKSVKTLKLHSSAIRATVNNKHFKIKQRKKRAKNAPKVNLKSTESKSLKSFSNSSTRHTRDFPYSYYQYSPSEKSYQTQETDWRREMVPSSLDSYAAYDEIGKQPLYQNQDRDASLSDQMSLNRNEVETQGANNELFSLPIASLVRRTEIPGNPHHISSISIVNDMLSDDQSKGYLANRNTMPILTPDSHIGYSTGTIDGYQYRSDKAPQNRYSLTQLQQYQPLQQSIEIVNGKIGQSTDQPDDTTDLPTGNHIKLAGIPLSSYASMNSGAANIPENQSPTASTIVIGSDQNQDSPLPMAAQQAPPKKVVNANESSLELDLTDPVHTANSQEYLADKMDKYRNISMLSNLLPVKGVPSEKAKSLPVLQLSSVSPSNSVSSSTSASASSSGAAASEINGPVNSQYSVLNDAAARQSALSTTPSATIFPTSSKFIENANSFLPGQDLTSIKQGDIDAPVQNAILPVSSKGEAYVENQSGDGQPTLAKEYGGNQSTQSVGANMDLPFPSRRKLPEPSKSVMQALSGLSSSFYGQYYSGNITSLKVNENQSVSSTETASQMTAKLTVVPTVTTNLDTENPPQMTSYDSFSTGTVPASSIIQYTKSFLHENRHSGSLDVTVDFNQQHSSSGYIQDYNSPIAPANTMVQPLSTVVDSSTLNSSNFTTVTAPYEMSSAGRNDTHKIASSDPEPSLASEVTKGLNIVPTPSVILKNIPIAETLTYKQELLNPPLSGHVSPETKVSLGAPIRHISPISDPGLRVSGNGSVLVLNHYKKRRPDINDIYNQYRKNEKNKAKLEAKRLDWLNNWKGCQTPLGLSNGKIADDQLSASSYLSPAFAPSKARLGAQRGSNRGWCADPRLNNITQYLQVDFRDVKTVCRVGMQSRHLARNWITHYKIAFSLDGRHWSIYKELNKDKVIQGIIMDDDWTSYNLVNPIHTRFIRILPQAWEGNEICTLVEFYSNDNKVDKNLHERSNIPSAMQNVIDYLNFEKVENEIVFDSSPMGNNAYLNKGAAVYDTHGKCRHAARIGEGSDILLDGRNMMAKPRQAISLSVWLRVDRTDGVHSIFDTIGAKSKHALGQYHFEIVGGAVRWFHRDENGTQIFSVTTEPNFISPREWNHLVVSYDSDTGLAKIYVNGSRVAETTGRGLLSQDWGGRVGLGRHKDTRDLVGDIDEFKIFSEAIQGEKILELSRECDFDKYYCGSVLTAERGLLITPDYPALHMGAVECIWHINGLPGEVVVIDVKEFEMNNCNASNLEIRDGDNSSLIGSYCGGKRPSRVESHGNQMIFKFTSKGSKEGERFKVEFHREKKRASKKTISSICRNSDLYQNMTLVGGSKAGTFTDLGQTIDIRGCQERCCEKESCEVAFMIEGNCYGVRCYDQDRCKIRKAKSTTLNPMLSFISREGVVPRVFPQFVEVKGTPQHGKNEQVTMGRNNETHQTASKEPRKCQLSETHHNVTLVRGMKSGKFTSNGLVKDFTECSDKCCQRDDCNAAFMVKRTCFSINCLDKDSCTVKPARPSSFNPTFAYVAKEEQKGQDKGQTNDKVEGQTSDKVKGQQKEQESEQNKMQFKPTDTSGTSKSTVIQSNVCTKSRISKVYRNVTLRDGINSGEFTDRGSVFNMEDCIKQCCSDDNCNLAFIIKDTCFTVKCKSYDACSLKAAISRYYNPRIAYVSWSPPKENLGVGSNKYDYKGCWRDFDMSAFAIPLLEGTDPILTGAYKKREDPVNDCATISQHRGYSVFAIQNGGACFSGPNAESTYKRYGASDACKGGRGGAFANSVYKLFDDGSVMSLGCWGDLQDRAFRRMEKIDDALRDPFTNRADPIGICSKVAKKHNSNMFALQKGGQCFIGKQDPTAFMRYGPSRKCRYGLGGQMANDVYVIRVESEEKGKAQKVEEEKAAKPILKNTTDLESIQNASDSREIKSTTTTPMPSSKTTIPSTTLTTATPTTTTTTTLASDVTTDAVPTTGANTEAAQGTVRQTTVSSKESAMSGNFSKQRAEVLGAGEVVYKEELTDAEHIKFIYSNGGVIPNVTLTAGINAGTFTDKGAIENMDDCVKSCGQTSNCDVAFKLGKQCFGVACYSTDTCHTKPAFSSYYNPLIAFVKHRMVKIPRNKEEHQLDSNPTERSLCIAKNNVENVTLVDGIGAGNFTDLGHVSDMSDCVSRCCSDSACELAFRIEDDCYGVTCYSEHSCRTRSARNAMSLKPMIAFVRDVGSRKVLTHQPKSKVGEKATNADKKKAPKCSSDTWGGETRENMTLVGGIGAGDFTDHGQTNTIEECMGYCCENKECDLAFMIDKDCYGVKCKEHSMCKTRPARPTKYRPIIAFKKSSEPANNKASPNIDNLEQFLTTKTNKLIGNRGRKPASINEARAGHVKIDDGIGVLVQPVKDIAKAMFKDRTTVNDNADDNTFAARSYYSPLTTNSPNHITTKTTPKTTMTVIPRPPGTTPGFSSTIVKSSSSATPTFADPMTKHSCEAGSIAYNATLKMGMHSGLFTKLGRVAKMDDCIERCCKSSNADVAFMLGSVCFAVKCYSPELCKVAPAMISNIGNLNMNPTLSFLRKKQSILSIGSDNNDIDAIIDEITDKTDDQETKQLSLSDHKDMLNKLQNISTIWEVHDRVRPNPKSSADDSAQSSCADNPITYNVTLKGGIHAGNFTNQGEGLSDRECISKCCEKKSCDVAFMFADLCYSVDCRNEDDCQAVVAKPSKLNPKVSFISRSRPFSDRGIMFDLSTTASENDVCDEAKLIHSPIMSNKTLAGGLHAGNFTYLGRTLNMRECLGKCCGAKKCDVAYRIDHDCFSVKCFSPELCKVSEAPARNGFVQIATLTPVEKLKLHTGSVAVYVMLGSVIFTVLISGLGMALCSLHKRKKMKSQHQQTEDTPLPDR